MHHKNSIISILLMGGFLALSLAACDGKPTDPYPPTTTTLNGGTTTTTLNGGTTTTTLNGGTTTTSSTTTTTLPPGVAWSFVGVGNTTAWTVSKDGVDQLPTQPQLTPVTVRVGDTVEWRVAGPFPHGVVFSSEAAATGMLTFQPGGQPLQDSPGCFPPDFTWGTNNCGIGFPAGTVLARATVKATGSLRFTCEVHGPANMTVDLNATP